MGKLLRWSLPGMSGTGLLGDVGVPPSLLGCLAGDAESAGDLCPGVSDAAQAGYGGVGGSVDLLGHGDEIAQAFDVAGGDAPAVSGHDSTHESAVVVVLHARRIPALCCQGRVDTARACVVAVVRHVHPPVDVAGRRSYLPGHAEGPRPRRLAVRGRRSRSRSDAEGALYRERGRGTGTQGRGTRVIQVRREQLRQGSVGPRLVVGAMGERAAGAPRLVMRASLCSGAEGDARSDGPPALAGPGSRRSVDTQSPARKRRPGRFDRAEASAVYARFTLHTADPARLGEVISHYENDISTAFTHEPGSRGMSVLVNDDLGVALVQAYWTTEDAMRSNDATFADPIHDAAFFGATVSIERYEVARFVLIASAHPGAAVSLTRLDAEPARLDDVVAAYDYFAVGSLAGSDGFCTAVLFVDRRSGRAVVETTWRYGEALVAARSASAARRLDAVKAGTAVVRGIEQYRLDFRSVDMD